MITIKAYLYGAYEEDYKGEDLSKYIAMGAQNTEDVSEEMDISEITLYGYPQSEEFSPMTKIIIDILEDGEIVQTLHRLVDNDNVEKTILSDNSYYTHSISLIEPSVDAQKRLVDNISIKYKLKDVNLEAQVINGIYTPMSFGEFSNEPVIYPNTTGNTGIDKNGFDHIAFSKYFYWEVAKPSVSTNQYILVEDRDKNFLVYQYLDINSFDYIFFILPKPHIMWRKRDGSYVDLGYASIDYVIKQNGVVVDKGTRISNSRLNGWLNEIDSDNLIKNNISSSALETCLPEDLDISPKYFVWDKQQLKYKIKQYTKPNDINARDFATATLSTTGIPFGLNDKFEIEVSIAELGQIDSGWHNFSSTWKGVSFSFSTNNNTTTNLCDVSVVQNKYDLPHINKSVEYTSTRNTHIASEVYGYDPLVVVDTTTILSSGVPYSVYNMIRKAIWNSGNYYYKPIEFIGGMPIYLQNNCVDIQSENSRSPYYIDNEFLAELQTTQVNETMFHQKNLWEVLIEAGHYLHAVPEIVFGDNNRYKITFNRLGRTDTKEDTATACSIYNYRGIDDYISATSSYVTNLVQLGGQVTEYVAPKTNDESYLVYNDVANIQVSKSIIELIKMEVICVKGDTTSGIYLNQKADFTPFVFEKSVYDILPIAVDQTPNKGYSLYYELGTNTILGCNYQSPQANTTAFSDYALKKAIYCAYKGYNYATISSWTNITSKWRNIKVNNFNFIVTYRTKDSARITSVRPDLRKYLYGTNVDLVPKQEQFNNQEEIYTDSVSLGKNLFGKLVKTGNTNYQVVEYSTSYSQLKHKGELYNIFGNLYYVAKATHTFFTDHIESKIEYSKDYNQLSQIVSIPSEPRFYEITEQSSIAREKVINDYVTIGTDYAATDKTCIKDLSKFADHLFKSGETPFEKYALTTFEGDEALGIENGTFGEPYRKDIMLPISAYSVGTTLTYEWDTKDNFSAGDKVGYETSFPNDFAQSHTDDSYRTLIPVQYCDKYGKASLLRFSILDGLDNIGISINKNFIRELPDSPYTTNEVLNEDDVPSGVSIWQENTTYRYGDYVILANSENVYNTYRYININPSQNIRPNTEYDTIYWGKVKTLFDNENCTYTTPYPCTLLKDSGESISVNYNISMLTDSDRFILGTDMFRQTKYRVSIVLLQNEVNKLSNGSLNSRDIMEFNGQFRFNFTTSLEEVLDPYTDDLRALKINIGSALNGIDLTNVKAIAIAFSEVDFINVSSITKFVVARNVDGLTNAEKMQDWYLSNTIID